MAKYFGSSTFAKNIGLANNGDIILKIKIDSFDQVFKIPSPSELQSQQIVYSENMYRLLELQKRVVDALVKVSDNNFSDVEKEQLARMMIYLN